MCVSPLCRLDQFINDVLRRWLIRITHTEIDNIFPARTRRGFQLVHDVEDIGWKAFDSGKIVFQGALPVGKAGNITDIPKPLSIVLEL